MEIVLFIVIFITFMLGRSLSPKKSKIQRATFVLNKNEAAKNYVFTDRLPDAGERISLLGLSDEDFFNRVVVTWNGLVCTNNPVSVQSNSECEFDVARSSARPWELLFSSEDRADEGDVIQVMVL